MNERFLVFAWAFLPLAVATRLERRPHWGRRIGTAAVVSAILGAAGLWHGFSTVDGEVRDAAAVLRHLPDGARLYPLEFDPAGPSLTHSPLLHLWSNYPTGIRVYAPYQFTFMDLMPVARRLPPSGTYFPSATENLAERLADGRVCEAVADRSAAACEEARSVAWGELMAAAGYYDHWFVHGAPSDLEGAIESTPWLELVSRQGRSALWRSTRPRPFEPALPR